MEIHKNLKDVIEDIENKGFKILFLIESGSRGWGWESEDSDYDIRGVFIQDYLKIDKEKKQIDLDIEKNDLDISLWDFKKFLRLMLKSNPTVWEWLSSDLVYKDHFIRKELKKIFENSFRSYSLKKHYLSMARQNFEKYVESNEKVNLKKYVYILRSIACVLWIQEKETPPPKHYKKIIHLLPEKIQNFFEKIVKDKRKSESLEGNKNEEVNEYVKDFFGKDFEKDSSRFNKNELNEIFKRAVNEYL